MKTLIVYPTYALSKDEMAYRVVSTLNTVDANLNRPKTAKVSFYSTSPMLPAPAGGPRRTVIDITDGDGDGEIGNYNPTDDPSNSGIAEYVPVGDVVLPMTLMLLGYVLYRRLAAKLKSL